MKESLKLAAAIKAVAEANDCLFLAAAGVAHSGEDGIHFSEDSNEPLAKLIASTVKDINNE
jgi:lysophospholipase L1-like esterase